MDSPRPDLQLRISEILDRIDSACHLAGRCSSEVTLIAVTKSVKMEQMRRAYDLGLRHFGESRFQEAEPKILALPKDIDWHFIGKIQSNKARRIGAAFHFIHSIDSLSQITELDKLDRESQVLIEVNVARETQKAGILPEALDEFASRVLNSRKLRLRGLMTIGPNHASHDEKLIVFRDLKKLADRLPGRLWLSMGMSEDFEPAIQEGSTHVRIGSALFGERSNEE